MGRDTQDSIFIKIHLKFIHFGGAQLPLVAAALDHWGIVPFSRYSYINLSRLGLDLESDFLLIVPEEG